MALEKINVPVVKNTRSSGLELLKGLCETPNGIAIGRSHRDPRNLAKQGALVVS
jgi:hypothetical protein